MAMRATAVIGALWGDEGKGSIVHDVVSSTSDTALVCRYSGGANAGHTVMGDDGLRHVFSHFGSGTFAGAETYLSRFFISNPILWLKELTELNSKGLFPFLLVDSQSPITTPIDIAINQALEIGRGMLRHGSCGVGINETVTRNEHTNKEFHGNAAILQHPKQLRDWLMFLKEHYLPWRMNELGLETLPAPIHEAIYKGKVIDDYCYASECFSLGTRLCDVNVMGGTQHVVFEGSQGLLLDECSPDFPHVTRARTGSHNIRSICNQAGIEPAATIYVSRAYSTRHGEGPFDPVHGLSYEDRTNMPNPWQGTMRFGHLNIDRLRDAITADFIDGFHTERTIAITCVDQIADTADVHVGGRQTTIARAKLAENISVRTGLPIRSMSYGPARKNISVIGKEAA